MPSSSSPTAERLVRTAAERTQGVVDALRDRASGDARSGGDVTVRQSITIETGLEELVAAARDARTLSTVLGDLGQVESSGSDAFRWTLHTPSGRTLATLDTTLTTARDHLRWTTTEARSGPPATLALAFSPAPQDRGTEVALRLELDLPPGTRRATGITAGGLAHKALHRFKALIRTGEVPTLKHNPAARHGGADHDQEG
jgi:uncharacterized membrane protein